MYDSIGFSAKYYGHNGAFPAASLLVGHDRIQLSAAERGFVDAQMRPDVLWKYTPSFGMKTL